MQWFVITFLRTLFLPFLNWTTRRGGERAWVGWELVPKILASLTGRFARLLCWDDRSALEGIMKLTDLADGLIGATGEWQLEGDSCAIKTIMHCPLAEQLTSTPEFCTNLGVIMGQEAYKTYTPNLQVDYKIPTTLSQGHISCQYIIKVKVQK